MLGLLLLCVLGAGYVLGKEGMSAARGPDAARIHGALSSQFCQGLRAHDAIS